MKIECAYDAIVDLVKLQPNPKNPNKHPDKQIDMLAKIINYQGQRSPIVVSTRSGFIVKGHGRLSAIQKLGWESAAVDYQDYEDEAQEFADMVADNKIAELAEHDDDMMKLTAQELGLDVNGFDLDLLGVPDLVIDVIDESRDAIEDEVPEVTESISKLGDLYELGEHRLLCGDSTDKATVERLMNGEKADICFTSPPYNLGENAKLRGYNGDGDDSAYNEKSDHKTESEYLDFLIKWTQLAIENSTNVFSNIQILAGNKFIMSDYWGHFKNHLVDLMVWDKVHAAPQMAVRVLNSVWEFIFIFTSDKNPKRSIKTGPEFRGTIPNIYRLNPVGKKDPLAKDHGAVFPVEFAQYFIDHFSNKSVLDLFGGSGSTLIACEKTKRKCYMMELDPHYIDVIVSRWCKYTGKTKIKRNGEEMNWFLNE